MPVRSSEGGGEPSDGTQSKGLPLEVDRLVLLDTTEGSWIRDGAPSPGSGRISR